MPKRTRDHQEWLLEKLMDPVRAATYLNTALEDSTGMFLEALRDVAQVRQMTRVAKQAGVTRESLYKATSPAGNPTFDTFVSVLTAMDLTFAVAAKRSKKSTSSRVRFGTAKHHKAATKNLAIKTAVGLQMYLDLSGASPVEPKAIGQQFGLLVNKFHIKQQGGPVSAPPPFNNLLPAHVSRLLLERDYGYTEACNTSQD